MSRTKDQMRTTGASGRLTWGQLDFVRWMQLNRLNPIDGLVVYDLDSAGGASTHGEARRAIVKLAQRHNVLHTLFDLPPFHGESFAHWEGVARQAVQCDTDPTIRELGGHLSPLDALKAVYWQGNRTSALDSWSSVPAWFIYSQRDGRWGCLIAAHHLFLDGVGAARLSEEYQALLRGVSTSDFPAAGNPLDLVAIERGARGAAISGRTLARMTAILEGAAEDQLVSLRDAESAVYTSIITSARLYDAISRLATRWQIPQGGVVLSLVACATWQRYKWSPLLLKLLVRMPVLVPNVAYVGLNTINTLLNIPVDSAMTIGRFGRLVWAASIDAFRYCAYDPVAFDGMDSEIAGRLGRDRINGLVHVNYHAISDVEGRRLSAAPSEKIMRADRTQGPTADRTMYDVAVARNFASLSVRSAATEFESSADLAAQLVDLASVVAASDDSTRLNDFSDRSNYSDRTTG